MIVTYNSRVTLTVFVQRIINFAHQFDWFGFSSLACVKINLLGWIRSSRTVCRSAVQWYNPLQSKWNPLIFLTPAFQVWSIWWLKYVLQMFLPQTDAQLFQLLFKTLSKLKSKLMVQPYKHKLYRKSRYAHFKHSDWSSKNFQPIRRLK